MAGRMKSNIYLILIRYRYKRFDQNFALCFLLSDSKNYRGFNFVAGRNFNRTIYASSVNSLNTKAPMNHALRSLVSRMD